MRPKSTECRQPNALQRFVRALGPGIITGAADDDPSGIGTYSIAGASLGFATLWTAIITFPLMSAVQFLCAKVGMVSGMGLAGVLRKHYSRPLLYLAVAGLVIANTINIGTDIGAIAAAINLIVPIPPTWLVLPIAVAIVATQVWGSYRVIARVLKWLTLTLFAYIGAAILARPPWREVLKSTFIPHLSWSSKYLTTLVAILGTTISPYLFFWQASEEVEEEIELGRRTVAEREGATYAELKAAAWDTNLGMLFCNLIFYFVILAAGATLYRAGNTDIQSPAEAAQALAPLAGQAASALFAIGLIGSGLLAVPVLSGSCAYAVSEAFGWECSLGDKPHEAKQFYLVIAASTLLGLLINFLGINPMAALFWTAVINGLLSPPLLIVVMLVSNSRRIMGDNRNGLAANIIGWIAVALMLAAATGMILTWSVQ